MSEVKGSSQDRDNHLCADGAPPVLTAGAVLESWKVSRPIMWVCDNGEYGFRVGAISTHLGVVALYDQARYRGNDPRTHLDFVHAGRNHRAFWPRTFTDRFLKTLAYRFAQFVVSDGASSRPPVTAGQASGTTKTTQPKGAE